MLTAIFPEDPVDLTLENTPSLVVEGLARRTEVIGAAGFLRDRITGQFSTELIRLKRVRGIARGPDWCVFYGRITADGRSLNGKFRASYWIRWFMAVWLLTILGVFLPVQIAQTAREGWTAENIKLGVTLPVLLVFGLLMPRIAWWSARSDRTRIKALLLEVTKRSAV